ncbi:MAG: sulfite exporter TauE/SafE family protein [Saprospiraceae bacterium]|nr:sulfite exporter TauE/SafE family protein [Saprospiraceae bacterium]
MNWEWLLIALVALSASMLTFFSGFGLGTILSACLFIFFEVPIAIAITGIVHLSNNLFKLILTSKSINWNLVKWFGIPAILGAIGGAYFLHMISGDDPLHVYKIGETIHHISVLKITMALVMVIFVFWDWLPGLKRIKFEGIGSSIGGLITGFFGGLSGHQGALRSAFLVKGQLDKNAYIATGVMIACLVDIGRIPVYFSQINTGVLQEQWKIIVLATLSAFIGTMLGNKMITKITIRQIQNLVACLLLTVAMLLGSGIL